MSAQKEINEFVEGKYIISRNVHLTRKETLIGMYSALNDEEKAAFIKHWEDRKVIFEELAQTE